MSAEHRVTRRRGVLGGEEGQAALLLIMMAVSMLFFLSLMYHTGTVIVLKMRLQNTADAAAMAAATVQARGMQQIARLNKEIVDTVIEANEDAFGSHAPFASDLAAAQYIDREYLARIDQLVEQIETIQKDALPRARDAASAVGTRNFGGVQVSWKAPRLRDNRLGDVFIKLKARKPAKFYYVRKGPTDSSIVRRDFDEDAYFDGKSSEVVYSAVEARIDLSGATRLGDTMFKSNISSMSAYAAAKPWGGNIGGFHADFIPNAVITRWDASPPIATLWMRRWNGPLALLHDPLDYDVWLVRIGDPRLDPPPTSIPEHSRFVH